jgi:hypothetical protein
MLNVARSALCLVRQVRTVRGTELRKLLWQAAEKLRTVGDGVIETSHRTEQSSERIARSVCVLQNAAVHVEQSASRKLQSDLPCAFTRPFNACYFRPDYVCTAVLY